MKEKIDNYLKTRGLLFFVIFICVNIIAVLPANNIIVDIFSHFRLQYLIFSFLFLVLFIYLFCLNKKYIVYCFVCFVFIFLNLFEIFPYIGRYESFNQGNIVKLALYNVLTSNKNYDGFLVSVAQENPDIIILQETDDIWLEHIKDLKNFYPYYIEHSRLDNFGISMYSKIPFTNTDIELWTDFEVPVVVANFKMFSQDLRIYGIHTLPPTSKDYFRVRNEMLKKINTISFQENSKNLVFAGDFNTTTYSNSYKKYIKSSVLKDCQILAKNVNGTWNARYIPIFRISLEHVLISPKILMNSFKIGKNFGSDHLPVYVELSF